MSHEVTLHIGLYSYRTYSGIRAGSSIACVASIQFYGGPDLGNVELIGDRITYRPYPDKTEGLPRRLVVRRPFNGGYIK
jgi:hypothetical protein